MPAPFVTVAQLGEYMGVSLTGNAVAEFAVDAACQVVRTYLDRAVNQADDEEVRIDGSGTDALLLPQYPVAEVTDVVVDDETLDELDEDDDANWRLGAGGILYRLDGDVWPTGRGNVVVTYTHGWTPGAAGQGAEEVPADIQLVTLLVARRAYQGRGLAGGDKKSETIGNYSYTLADAEAATGGLTKNEMRALDKYVRRGVVA